MGNQWTGEQRKVIEERGCSLLVSAAAGSGKTAVLVERILSLVTDPLHPTEIDHILVVTFTKAAAGEMRERIRTALEKAAGEDPANRYLARQAVLVHHAKIMTIDSFCLDVIKSHFNEIGLDPAFRVGDEGELLLLRQEVLANLLEDAYAEDESGAFGAFSENLAPGKNDHEIEERIDTFYQYSMGFPWPGQWRRSCLEPYSVTDREGLENSPWMQSQMQEAGATVRELQNILEEARKLCRESDGPWMYEAVLEEDRNILEALHSCRTYRDYVRCFETLPGFSRLPSKKDMNVSEDKKKAAKLLRDEVKDAVRKMEKELFALSEEDLLTLLQQAAPTMEMLVELTDRFQERFEAEKRDRGIVDFSDLEHMALQILVNPENGAPTAAAEEYAGQFREIMIDEYQDSNLTQEVLLGSISGEAHSKTPNLFMVGDVKQSIYRFRLARPELFMEKFAAYRKAETEENGSGEERKPGDEHLRIDLHKNFRSRHQVLRCVNEIFFRVMGRETGRIEYDEEAALYSGAVYEEPEEKPDPFLPELLLMETPGDDSGTIPGSALPDSDNEESLQETESRYAEARETARRIRELAGSCPVRDETTGQMRPARFSDMVILLRSMSGWGEVYTEVLTQEGIPSVTETGSGYFTAPEIRTMMAFLTILDNPRQDIPLAGVLHSPLGGLDDEMLAKIRIRHREGTFYEACRAQMQEDTPEGNLLRAFFERLDSFRSAAEYLQIHELIWKIMDETGYGSWVQALPAGEVRRANLEMLAEKAAAFEQGSYRGLFHFIRYIEKLKKYEIDYAQAQPGAGAPEAVRIMTIHKSKGLEFPIVIVGGLGKSFNRQSSSASFVMHPELGAGFDFVDEVLRIRCASPVRRAIADAIKKEDLGEELRVLYVALTRAKEKLILTGTVKDVERAMEKWTRILPGQNGKLPAYAVKKSGCFLDLLMPALLDHLGSAGEDPACTLRIFGKPVRGETAEKDPGEKEAEPPAVFNLRREMEAALASEEAGGARSREELLRRRLEEIAGRDSLQSSLPEIPPKMSVSELKHQWMDLLDEESGTRTPDLPKPKEEGQSGQLSAAERGTLYHRVMELLDFEHLPENGDYAGFVQFQLESMMNCDKIQKDVCSLVRQEDIAHFLASPLAARMHQAAKRGTLHKETPFVLGVSADTLQKDWDRAETVLIQGIIDAWFEEDDGIILVDYKTDAVKEGEAGRLLERYRMQMEYYRLALERLTRKKVTEMGLYSFRLGRFLRETRTGTSPSV